MTRSLESLARQQSAVAGFGQRALEIREITALCREAVEVVAETLDVPIVAVLETAAGDDSPQLRALVGLDDGDEIVDELRGVVAYTLQERQTVVADDLASEGRFPAPRIDGITSALATVVGRLSAPYGVLILFSSTPGFFSSQDFDFVRAIANTVGALVTRTRQRQMVIREREGSQQLMNSLGQGITVVNEHLIFEYVNPAYAEMLGVRRRDVLGKRPQDFMLEADIPKLEQAFEHRRGNRPSSYEATLVRSDGEHIPVIISGVPRFHHGRFAGATAVVTNISEMKRYEDSLRSSEEQFRVLFDLAPIGMAIVALDGTYIRVNRAFCHDVGYSAEELLGMNYRDILHPDDRSMISGRPDPLVQSEIRCIRKDGTIGHALMQVALIRDKRGEPMQYVAQIVDITEKKALEEQYRQGQKMEAIGRLAGGIAHDFNNILTAIIGYSGMIETYLGNSDDARLRKYAEQIDKAAQRAATLTRQLLAYSRQQVLQPRVLDLNVLVSGLTEILSRLIGEDVELRTELADDLRMVRADPGQVEQVLMNLVINARDAMPRGGKLTVATSNVRFDEESVPSDAEPGDYVLISISDTGEGIDEGVLEYIFEPFFTTKEQGVGTGLGLATVQGIVSQSDGFVDVESEAGTGTTFRIYLPVTSEAVAEPVGEMGGGIDTVGKTGTVLIVEDEEFVRDLAEQLLSKAGFKVIAAADAATGIEAFEREARNIDLLLTDVILTGGTNGPELADELRRRNPALKVLFVSGYTDNAINDQGVMTSDSNFLQKPFAARDLLGKVGELLAD